MKNTKNKPNNQATEVSRRRSILSRYIGEQVFIKRTVQLSTKAQRFRLKDRPAKLVRVNRTKVVLDFGDDLFEGEWLWDFHITAVLLPGSIEPAPGQRELFAEGRNHG